MTRVVFREHVYLLSKLAIGLAAISLVGCGGGGSSPPAQQTATAAVTPEAGGTVKLPDNSVQLNVPPGAVPANTMITMTTTDATAPQGVTAVSPVLQFEPDGTVFQKPVTVTFTFKNAMNPVVFWSNSMGGYDLIEGTVSGSTIAAPVMHFSKGFVGERPAGGSDKCADGVVCTAGATCGFGGTTMAGSNGTGTSGGSTSTGGGSASQDGGAMTGAPNSGPPKADGTGAGSTGTGPTGTGTGGGSMGGSVDASASTMPIDPGGPKPAATSALSSSAPSAAVCCSCGADGVFHCSLCQGSTDTGGPSTGADGGATASPCAEGATCSAPGSGCGVGPSGGGGGPAGGGSTSATGAPMASGNAAPDSTGVPQSAGGSAPSGGGTCCMCGSDGHYHCTSPCANPTGGVDASAGGATGGGFDGGVMGGGPIQGDAGGGTGGPPTMCVPGAACTAGMPACKDASTMSCSMCSCGAGGMITCQPCPGPDGGVQVPPPADGGAGGGGPLGCMPGASCALGGPNCQSFSMGACYACQCVDPGMLKCSPCNAPPPADAGAPMDPAQCAPGLKCQQPGAACGTGPLNGVCTKCMCGADGTYACQQMAC
jgi:hypothetical protein